MANVGRLLRRLRAGSTEPADPPSRKVTDREEFWSQAGGFTPAVLGLEDRITAVRAAVGTSESDLEFGVFEESSGKHMVIRDDGLRSKFTDREGRRILTVPGATLDGLLAERQVDPGAVGLVWVDTQGHEAHVLRGASQLLDRPVPMLIEFHPGMLGDTLPDLQELVMERFTHVLDVRGAKGDEPPPLQPVASMPQLVEAYLERPGTFTDLLLLNL